MNIDGLRSAWHKATEKDRPHEAIKALVELERLDPREPRWSQRLGEQYRRVGSTPEAVGAFVRAFEGYLKTGFLPRAIAMAKLVGTLDAARGDLLERALPRPDGGGGRSLAAALPVSTSVAPQPAKPAAPPAKPPAPSASAALPRPGPPPAPIVTRAAPPPLPREPSIVPRVVRPTPLAPAPDAADDEIRFDDDPSTSLELMLVDFLGSDVVTIDADDDGPPTRPIEGGSQTLLGPPDVGPESSQPETQPSYDRYAAMASFRLFAALSRDALVALSNVAEVVEFVPTAMIIVRDERAFALYAIVSGTAKVSAPGTPDIVLREGDVFGESVLLDEGQRQADVRAETDLMTLRIEKAALDELVGTYPEIEDALFDLLARRLVTNLLHKSPLFAAFDPAGRLELAQKFEVRRAAAGTTLAQKGRRSDGLYVILAGNVMAENDVVPTRIARGTAFGQASLLDGSPSDVTIRAATEAVLLRMPAAAFASLAALYPPALAHLADTANEPLPTSQR